MTEHADVLVVGGGIIGLAVAKEVQHRSPAMRAVVLEKEREVASHQTGRNSGVIHSGIYYKPGSLKAETCRRGIALLRDVADRHGIEHDRCGKVIVATDEQELARLGPLCERGEANGVTCRKIGPEELRELEPACAGLGAIHVEDTGIIDYVGVCRALASEIAAGGGAVECGAAAVDITRDGDLWRVTTRGGAEYTARRVVNCAGLHSDRVARQAGESPEARIVPFRGEYFELTPEARGLCRNLIYPVPDPSFPFLGVHFTRMISRDAGGHRVECGPNAVLALAREGYGKATVNPRDLLGTVSYPAFWKIAARHWRTGLGEMHRSLSKAAFVRALQKLVPEIQPRHLEPAPSGVRAQALGRDGTLLDDFAIIRRPGIVHVLNAPSPGATASLAIAERVVDQLDHSEARAR